MLKTVSNPLLSITPADGVFAVGDGTKWVGESGNTALTSLGIGGLSTASGVLTATPPSTATTITAVSGIGALYIVSACIAFTGTPNLFTANARVMVDGNGARIVSEDTTNLILSLSGLNIQVTQISGSNQDIVWKILRIA